MAQNARLADAGVSVGQVFLGKYRVESILGHGGMGVVAKCTHLGLNDPVAIKMLRQDVLLDRDATERFMREAQAAFKLRSEHVARVVDVGTDTETGVPYMVMEFLDGHDLGQLVDQNGPLAHGWASMLMLQAAEALAEAHSIGIVHRDVKPSNLFVTWRPDGSSLIKVLDFGISKAPTGTDMQLTQTQSLLGTPAYMSPEQMRSARLVDLRTDIWSLGVVFYELLEGRRPFEAESFSEMCVKVAVDPPTPMTNTPPPLQQVVLRCLAKSPDQRYANMAELGRDLLPYVQDVHEASLLVERMQRMAGRRAAADWDRAPGTNGGRASTPVPVRDLASGAVATPPPMQVAPSGPIPATPLRTATPAAGVPVSSFDGPLGSTATEIGPPVLPRRSRLPLVLAALALVTGAAAVAFVVSNGSSEDAPAAIEDRGGSTGSNADTPEVAADKPEVAADKPVAAKPATDDPVADKPIAAKPATDDPVADKPATDDPVADKPAADKPAADKPAAGKPAAGKPAAGKPAAVRPPRIRRHPPRGAGRQTPKPDKHDDKPKPPDCPIERRIPGGGCAPE